MHGFQKNASKLTFASFGRKSEISRLTSITAGSLNSRLTKALSSVRIAAGIFTAVRMAVALYATHSRVNVPEAYLTVVARLASDMRPAVALTALMVTVAVYRTGRMAIAT